MTIDLEALQNQMLDDLQWATEDAELQQKYAGQLVVVHKRQVLAAGCDEGTLLDAVASPEHPWEELVVVQMLGADFDMPPDMIVPSDPG